MDDDPEIDSNSICLEKFRLYETRAWYYLIGTDKSKRHWRVLKIDRSEPSDLVVTEDPAVYTERGCRALLHDLAEGNKLSGGLNLVTKAYGVVGFAQFLEPYYMLLVTKRKQIGTVCGHAVYGCEETQLITVPHPSVQSEVAHSKTELRYKKLLLGVELASDFFFSHTYPVMQCLQANVGLPPGTRADTLDSMFVWNSFLARSLRRLLGNSHWLVALVHGAFKQTKLSLFGRVFVITLIARRSRHFAGTRYLKRGVNDRGHVANDVETEQIVLDEDTNAGSPLGRMTSLVQVRGSIPLFWSQEASRLSPKPDIVLQRFDPIYSATKLHFEDLEERYGCPIIILNLIKTKEKRPREMILRREFATAVQFLNQSLPDKRHLNFIHWDFHKFSKSKSANVLAVLSGLASECLDLTGFYFSGKPQHPPRPRGVARHILSAQTDLLITQPSGRDFLGSTLGSPLGSAGEKGRTSPAPLRGDRERDLELAGDSAVAGEGIKPMTRNLSREILTATAPVHGDSNSGFLRDLNSLPLRSAPSKYPRLGEPTTASAAAQTAPPSAPGPDEDPGRQASLQRGVLRTNCIDCLDRTNVAQFAVGLEVLRRQLYALGLAGGEKLTAESGVGDALMGMYEAMGDALALQYGGSAAHNMVFPEKQGRWRATTQSREFLKSIRRYYRNTYTDADKQDAINLFLGHFHPVNGSPALWELDSDYYLHINGTGSPEDSPSHRRTMQNRTKYADALAAPCLPAPAGGSGRHKLTSMDKLTDGALGSLKSVRIYGDDSRARSPAGTLKSNTPRATAPDAVEIQLRSPNWLFGQRKADEAPSTGRNFPAESPRREDAELAELQLAPVSPRLSEEELYDSYVQLALPDSASWYGTSLLHGAVESSAANQFYALCCQGLPADIIDVDIRECTEMDFTKLDFLQPENEEVTAQAMQAVLEPREEGGEVFTANNASVDSQEEIEHWPRPGED